jgi:cytochrome c553
MAAATPLSQAASIEAGKAKVAQVCAACHGPDGVSVSDTIPNLACHKSQDEVNFMFTMKELTDAARR